MQLQIDPLVDAHAADLFDVARPRPKRQSVQDLDDLFVGWKWLVKTVGSLPGRDDGEQQCRNAQCESEAFHKEFTSSRFRLQPITHASGGTLTARLH